MPNRRSLALALLGGFIFCVQTAFAVEQRIAVITQDTAIYRSPDATSDVIGRYRQGVKLRVYYPAKNDFYAVYFATEIQNTHYGWIPAMNLQVQDQPAASSSSNSGHPAHVTSTIGVFGKYFTGSPSTFETAMGDPAASVAPIAFGASYWHRFGHSWAAEVQADYFSLTQTLQNTATTGFVNFSASGFELLLTGQYCFYEGRVLSLWGVAGVGVDFLSAGGSNTVYGAGGTQQVNTSGITAFPLQAAVSARMMFADPLGAFLNVGYQLLSIGNIPYASPQTGTYSSANFAINGLFVTLGLTYGF